MKRAALFFLLLLPLALAATPQLPGIYWGDVNAPCNLVQLAPGISVRAEHNGVVLAIIPLRSEGNLFRFGGPSAGDQKLVVELNAGQDFNLVLYYSSRVSPFVLGSEDFNAGEVKYLRFALSDDNCAAIFPNARYSVSVSIPSDCNGSLNGLSLKVYHGGTELASATLSGDKSASVDVTVNGLAHGVPEGASISFRVCNGDHCASTSTSFNYGEDSSVSLSPSCSSLFPQPASPPPAAGGEMNAPASGESNALSSGSPGGVKSTSEQNVVAPQKKVSGPPKVPVPPEEENKPVVQHVLEQIDRGPAGSSGCPRTLPSSWAYSL